MKLSKIKWLNDYVFRYFCSFYWTLMNLSLLCIFQYNSKKVLFFKNSNLSEFLKLGAIDVELSIWIVWILTVSNVNSSHIIDDMTLP